MPSLQIHPRVSLNMACSMSWPLSQDIAFYRSRGVRDVTVSGFKLAAQAEALAAIRTAGLRSTALMQGGVPLIEDPSQALERLKPSIALARELGAPSLYFLTGPAPPRMPTDTAFDLLVEALGPMVDCGRAAGVRILVEPNSYATRSTGFVHTLADAGDLARATGVGICLEFQNCWYERRLPQLFRENLNHIALVQVSDFRVGEEFKLNRRVPGDGDAPIEWMMGQLLEAGYAGFFDLEMVGPAIEQEGYAQAMDRGLEWLSERLTRWGV
jgi:sugar phosphate isomerase/epimerase